MLLSNAQAVNVTNVTRGAIAMTSTIDTRSPYGADNLIDQVGLNNGYANNVTLFTDFVSTARHFSSTSTSSSPSSYAANWLANTSTASGFLNFDLGSVYTIEEMAWFNLATTAGARVTSLKVYADNDSDASNGVGSLLFTSGTFGDAAGSSGSDIAPNVFTFNSSATTRYLVVELLANAGSTITIGAGEVVFSQVPVPEPSTSGLAAIGLLVCGLRRNRRRA